MKSSIFQNSNNLLCTSVFPSRVYMVVTMKDYTNGSIPRQYCFDTNYLLPTTHGPQKFSKIWVFKINYFHLPRYKITPNRCFLLMRFKNYINFQKKNSVAGGASEASRTGLDRLDACLLSKDRLYIILVEHKKVKSGQPVPEKSDTRPVIKDPRLRLLIIYNCYC